MMPETLKKLERGVSTGPRSCRTKAHGPTGPQLATQPLAVQVGNGSPERAQTSLRTHSTAGSEVSPLWTPHRTAGLLLCQDSDLAGLFPGV